MDSIRSRSDLKRRRRRHAAICDAFHPGPSRLARLSQVLDDAIQRLLKALDVARRQISGHVPLTLARLLEDGPVGRAARACQAIDPVSLVVRVANSFDSSAA